MVLQNKWQVEGITLALTAAEEKASQSGRGDLVIESSTASLTFIAMACSFPFVVFTATQGIS